MNVLHVIPRLSREGGGPSRSCQGLVVALSNKGVTTSLLSLYKGDEPWVDGVSDYMNAVPFKTAIAKSRPDIVHFHEIWNWRLHKCIGICIRLTNKTLFRVFCVFRGSNLTGTFTPFGQTIIGFLNPSFLNCSASLSAIA